MLTSTVAGNTSILINIFIAKKMYIIRFKHLLVQGNICASEVK